MKERILTGWTFQRAVYVLMGSFLIYQSALTQEWVGIVFGGYFAAMGVFAFGCAAGNCYGGKCAVDPGKNAAMTLQEVKVEVPDSKP
ncbi:MAG: hypothetical protein RIQ78_1067 [Bacteroidota bacterium]|jgi:hypothetical protein